MAAFAFLSIKVTNDVTFSRACPVIGHEFRHNNVKLTVVPQGGSRVHLQTTLTML